MKNLFLIALLLFCTSSVFAQTTRGTVKESLTVKSQILGKDVKYTIYLPFDYETSQRFYPVTYLLHGYSDNDMGWVQFGEANMIADEAIAKREIPPMIIVMPDGGVSWYMNNFDGSVKYEDFFFKEFIPTIEKAYRIRPEKRYRAVSGLSMGGHGALIYALRHTDMFSSCAAFSSGVFTDDEMIAQPDETWKNIFAILYGANLKGKDRLTELFKSYSAIHIVNNSKPDQFKGLRLYMDCGDDDFLYKGNAMLHIALRDKKIPHEFRVRDGGHTWTYWRTGLKDALQFIGASFHQM